MERSIASEHSVRERDIGFLRGLAVCAAGAVLALTQLYGIPAPFAAAGICLFGGADCIFMFVGAAAGYIINGGAAACVPYIAAMGVLTLMRLVLGTVFHSGRSELLRVIQSFAAGICVFAANIFMAKGVYDLFTTAAFAAVSAVFVLCADKLRSDGIHGIMPGHSIGTSVSLCIVFVLLTAALTSLQLWTINVGIFLSVLAILCSSDMNADASAAVCAVLSSAGIAIGNSDFSAVCIMISVTAPVIMLIGKHSRITKACAFILTVGTGLIITGITLAGGIAAMSSLAAAVLYIAVPERYSPFGTIICRSEIMTSSRPYAAFGRRLGNMSSAIDDMRSAVIHTAEALEHENIRDISWVYNKAADSVCRKCPSNMKCWGSLYNDTADIMNKAVGSLRQGVFVSGSMLGGHLTTDCFRRNELAAALNRQYAVYCSAESSSRKLAEMRNVLTSQLGATEKMLRKMSEELGHNDTYDDKAAEAAERILTDLGLSRPAVIALIINKRLSIDAYADGDAEIPPDALADMLSFAVHRELDLPLISRCDGRVHITISERARYDAQIRVFRKSKTGNRKNGDCSECFNDGCGNVYMLLSDGMGSGSRARIDSAFTCGMLSKMLKAGIDIDSSLEMLNTSLLVKSDDESFATLDLCRIDLNTGDVTMCRAGGASAYVRCGNSFAQIKEGGLPLGISPEAQYTGKTFRLSAGDVIIMTSDGAELDPAWLEQLVMREKHADIEKIIITAGEAVRLASDRENDDDITIIGVKLIK